MQECYAISGRKAVLIDDVPNLPVDEIKGSQRNGVNDDPHKVKDTRTATCIQISRTQRLCQIGPEDGDTGKTCIAPSSSIPW